MADIYDIHDWELLRSGGYTENNVPLPPVVSERKGYIEKRDTLKINKNGENVVSKSNIHIGYDPSITTEDRVKIGAETYEIASVNHDVDFSQRKTKIYLV